MRGEWLELCAKDDLHATDVDDVELKAATDSVGERRTRRRKRSVAKDTVQVVKEEHKHKDLVSLEAAGLPNPQLLQYRRSSSKQNSGV